MATRRIKIANFFIGTGEPVAIQTMCATKTCDIEATAAMAQALSDAGAALVRIAVDTDRDAEALAQIRRRTSAALSVDLQENYLLAEKIAPYVDKIRYNPGHLHHRRPEQPWEEKVRYLAQVADDNDVALRVGVNCGSLSPASRAAIRGARSCDDRDSTRFDSLLKSAVDQTLFLDSIGFFRYCVSIKDSDPEVVIAVNRRFRQLRPEVPLHLGVTEAGLHPVGVMKSRHAMERLLSEGIGETLRVSLTVENDHKIEEVEAGKLILRNVAQGVIFDPALEKYPALNIVSCPSCSRVQNGAFVALARKVREATAPFADRRLTIAVMGCRVNGPGETDDADFGLWCGPDRVHLKKGSQELGSWPYDEILDVLLGRLKEYFAGMDLGLAAGEN